MSEEIQIRKLSIADAEQFQQCFNAFEHRNYQLDHFYWQYGSNPAGSIQGYGAFFENQLSGIFVVSPVRFQLGKDLLLAAQSMDVLTLPVLQGKGIFKRLAQKTYADLAGEGQVKFTYGFPNASSCHGFVKYLNWTLLDPVPYHFRLLRTSFLNKKLGISARYFLGIPPLPLFPFRGPRYTIRPIQRIPSDVNHLWEAFRQTYQIGLVRDEAYLRWRFEQRPATSYLFYEARDQEDRLLGLAILRMTDKHGGRLAYLMELMTLPQPCAVFAQLLSGVVRSAYEQGAEMIIAWIMEHHPYRRIFLRQGFLPLPRSFWPVELHFGFTAHDQNLTPVLARRRSWYLSYADSDTV